MPGTVRTEQYIYSERVIYDEWGNEIARERNYDDAWYDTRSVEDISDEELEDYR